MIKYGFEGLPQAIEASTAAMSGFVAVMAAVSYLALDKLIFTSDEAAKKATESARAYDNQKAKVEGLNSELATTQARIDELKAKGSLSLVEQEELSNLESANAKLQTQLEIEKQIAQYRQSAAAHDANSALTDSSFSGNFKGHMKLGTSGYNQYSGLYSRLASSGDMIEYAKTEFDIIQQLMAEEDKYIKHLEGLEPGTAEFDATQRVIDNIGSIRAKFEGDLGNVLESVRSFEGSLYDSMGNVVVGCEDTAQAVSDMWEHIETSTDEAAEAQKQIDDFLARPTIEKYTESVKEAFERTGKAMSETDFRKFFPELAAEADKSGVEIVDIINTIASALGLLDFDEVRRQLQKMKPSNIGISAQDWFSYIGGLTEENLTKLYDAMQSGMDFSTWSLPDFDAFLNDTEEATSSITTLTDAYSKFDTAAESVNKLTDAYEKLADGSLELTDVVALIQEFPELADYVDLTADNFGNLDDGLRDVARDVPDEVVNSLRQFAETADITESQRQSILGLADAMADMPAKGIEDVTGEFVTLHDAIMEAKQAVSEIEEAMNKDTNTGYESRSEAFQEMMELFKSGATGSSSKIWDIAEAMGYIGEQDPATLWEWVKAREAWYDTGEDGKLDSYDSSGIESFLKYVTQTEEIQSKLAELGATFKYENGMLDMDFDNASWAEVADAIGITKDEFTDLMTQAGQFFDIDWEDLNDIADYMDEVTMSTQSTEDRLKQVQDAAREALSGTNLNDAAINHIVDLDGLDHWVGYMDNFDEATQRILTDLFELKAQMSALKGGDPMGFLEASANARELTGKLQAVGIEASYLRGNVVQIPIESFATSLAESGWSQDAISTYVSTLMSSENIEFTSEGEVIADTTQADKAIDAVIDKKEQLSTPESTRYTVTGSGASTLNTFVSQWASITQSKTTDYYVNTHYSKTGNNDAVSVNGTAHASGNWGTKRSERALTGELGQEIVVDPSSGRWYTVGDNGAEFVRIPKGAIVFNHKQTEALLKNGYVTGRGKAYLEGTAYASSSSRIFKATSSSYGGYSSSKTSKSSSYSSSNKVSSSTASSSSNTELENWFEKQYAYHQHLVAMEQETDAAYLNWLMAAYPKAYKEGIITLEDYYQYQEEVFEGLRNIYDDYLNDIEHEVSMREHFKGEEQAIINLYKNAIKSVQAEINEARKSGLKDNDEYIQTLQDRYWSLYEALEDMRNSYTENAKDATDDLINLRINMLKQGIKDEKDANSTRLKNLKEFYQKQKDLLKDAADEDKYLKEQTEKRKAVTDLQMELDRLSYDNSAWAQKRRLELEEDLAKAQEELSEFEKDHALDVATTQLDELYEKQEKAYNDQNDLLDAKLNNARVLYNQALRDVRKGSTDLYNEMIEYNNVYGDGIKQTIVDSWQKAYAALNDYYNLFGKTYNKINLTNETGYDQTKKSTENAAGSWDTNVISDKGTKVTAAQVAKAKAKTEAEKVGTWKSNSKGWWYEYGDGTYAKSEWKTINGKKYHFDSKGWMETGWIKDGSTWYYLNSSGAMQTGWIKLNGTWYYLDKDGKMVTGTQKIDGKSYTFNKSGAWLGYASGTKNAKSGLHRVDEHGDEFVFESANGNRYRMFSGGEKVLNAKATDFLYQFATSGGKILTDLIKSSISHNDLDSISNSRQNVDITMGDIIINGNADQRTVSQIRREQREGMDYVLTQFARLRG